jgi:hypothetical protein
MPPNELSDPGLLSHTKSRRGKNIATLTRLLVAFGHF